MHDGIWNNDIYIYIYLYIDTKEWPFNLQPYHKQQMGYSVGHEKTRN